MLYQRDYRNLTPEESTQLQIANEFRSGRKGILSTKDLYKYHHMMPTAGYHYESLFPNNYLNLRELENHTRLDKIKIEFSQLLEIEPSERAVLNFINSKEYYSLIGAILKESYYFGHHGAYAFKEFALPPNFVADYLLVGKSSGGYEFVFVELESPVGSVVNSDGTFGVTIRKGLKQIEEWDQWIDSNFSHLRLIFQKHLGITHTLSDEFIALDKSRIHYAVVAGRRTDYLERTYRLRRKLKKERNITLLHYDNLIDTLEVFKSSGNY